MFLGQGARVYDLEDFRNFIEEGQGLSELGLASSLHLAPVSVSSVDDDKREGSGQKRIWLSLCLSLLYKGLTLDAVQDRMVLTAQVKSVEDHGNILHFGVPLFTGFLPRSGQVHHLFLNSNFYNVFTCANLQYTIAMMGYGPEDRSAVLELTYNYGVKEYDKDNAYAQDGLERRSYKEAGFLRFVMVKLGELKLGELLDSPPPGLDEAIAISNYAFGSGSSWLLWLRYNTFLILYPPGITSEVGMIYIALAYIKASEKYFIRMSNKWNFSFDYFYAAIIALGNYVPRSALGMVVNVFL
ncbi:uncharacterized protein A4U43_C07F11620 [Asparagus officinalis]|uniref:very-long-chain (3R)-3-hydroxyacyl-CoA dehydratase n=1 Tax=Asparagus officinalis TaxID=4686 RepID=A0A5P1EGC7_ASPOF|nr:uncharacterized protein A4U43_C07F11620 [Asparagus officinalis]